MSTVLICCDKFKGSASSAAVSEALARGLESAGHNVVTVPLADGGDGTLEVFDPLGYHRESVLVRGPDGETIVAEYALNGSTAVIEIARACGLDMASPDGQSPSADAARQAGSWGVGELIVAALDKGVRRIIVGLGGSATTDAGFGMAQALGVVFLDVDGLTVSRVGDIRLIRRAHLGEVDPRLAEVEFVVASDVRNPLCGPDGAAAIYGPQKGLTSDDVVDVDAAICSFTEVIESALRTSGVADRAGAGAAGGLGFMAMALLSAEMRSGVDLILDETGGEEQLAEADLVITGEGRIDTQTLSGKAPAGIAERARARGIPVVAVCGQNQLGSSSDGELFETIHSLTDYEANVDECIRNPLPILERIGRDLAVRHLR